MKITWKIAVLGMIFFFFYIVTTCPVWGDMPDSFDAMKIISGQSADVDADNDINGDGKIGLPEAIYLIQMSHVEYTVTFLDHVGTELKSETVFHGGAATAPEDPARSGYTFNGWDAAFDSVTGDLTVTALWTINTYKVTFLDYDGTVLKTERVDHGSRATAPDDPSREGYIFTGWDQKFDTVTADLTVTALYEYAISVNYYFDSGGVMIDFKSCGVNGTFYVSEYRWSFVDCNAYPSAGTKMNLEFVNNTSNDIIVSSVLFDYPTGFSESKDLIGTGYEYVSANSTRYLVHTISSERRINGTTVTISVDGFDDVQTLWEWR